MEEGASVAGQEPAVRGPAEALPRAMVVIGASAGGLEAVGKALGSVTTDLGAAFLVVQHLSPQHPSMLATLLGRTTRLPVECADDGVVPQPNHVYVVPANADVVLEGGRLRLSVAEAHVHPVPSIDRMLESLAAECGPRGIAVILSGTGRDGARGVAEVHRVGGHVIVQVPATARYAGMPQAALQTGCVDRLIAPAELGQALGELLEPSVARLPGTAESTFDALLMLLGRSSGVNFAAYKRATLERRVDRRRRARGHASLEEYLEALVADHEEQERLAADLLVSVTAFFRDPTAFEALAVALGETLAGRTAGDPVRVWVPGCATGEEVYSVAILLAELAENLGRPLPWQIFATDLDTVATRVARRAVYPRSALRGVSPGRVERYFEAVTGGWRVLAPLRERVVFARHDLTTDPPFARIDLVSCRNVLIYFGPELQARVLALFHFGLRPGGLLLLGRSEGVQAASERFEVVDRKSRLFRARPGGKRVAWQIGVRPPGEVQRSGAQPQMDATRAWLTAAAETYLPPAVVIDAQNEIQFVFGDVAPCVALPRGRVALDLPTLIEPGMRSELLALLHRVRAGEAKASGRMHATSARPVRLAVHSLPQGLVLVAFEAPQTATAGEPLAAGAHEAEVEQELRLTREHLQTVIEEMETSNEELQSLNEELQATNEELQTSNEQLETTNEELQATNQELLTVNDELGAKTSALATALAELQHIQTSFGFALIAVDRSGQVVRANLAAERLFDLQAPCPLGALARLMDGELLEQAVTRVQLGGRHEEHVVAVGERWHALNLSPWVAGDAGRVGVLLTFADRTRLVRAEQALAATTARLRSVMDHTPALVFIRDLQGHFEYANPAFLGTFGVGIEEVLGQAEPAVLGAALNEQLRLGDLEAIRRRSTVESEEVVQTGAGPRVLLVGRFALQAGDGTPSAVCSMAVDITERRRTEDALASQRELLRAVIDSLASGICVLDAAGVIVAVNRAWEDFARTEGFEPYGVGADYLGVCERAANADGDARRALAAINAVREGRAQKGIIEYPCATRAGQRWFTMAVTPLERGRGGVVVAHTDTTLQRVADDRLRLVAAVFENASEGILVTGSTGRVITANQAAQQITGLGEADLVGRTWRSLGLHLGAENALTPVQFFARLRRDSSWRGEVWWRRSNGREQPLWLTIRAVRAPDGRIANYVAMFTDLSRLKEAEHSLYRLAYYDELTDLPNRTLFHERLEHALALAERSGRPLAVAFVDLDRFKVINDSLGHDAGDELLRIAAQRLRECVRRSDLVARLGGDEFVVMLEELRHQEDAAITAQKIIAALEHPFSLRGAEVQVSASVGITLFPHDARDAGGLLKSADTAMYHAKERGRNRYQFFTPAMHQRSQRRLWLETELRHALSRNELHLVFEPQQALPDGRRRAVEALLRWRHQSGEVIEPTEFVPVAEETGLILPIGEWVLDTACRNYRDAVRQGAAFGHLAVNVSPFQLREPGFPDAVAESLSRNGLDAGVLELELTETALLEPDGHMADALRRLRADGVRLALDDFGTGYSSLTSLQRFPVEAVKVDRSFVRDIVTDANDAKLVRSVLAMGAVLGIEVVAEGVESAEQLALLGRWSCPYVQGRVLGPSLVAEQLRD